MGLFYKRPVVINAVQWEGTKDSFEAILQMGDVPWEPGEMGSETFIIKTLEGDHLVRKHDFVIKGVMGEFYLCNPDIFEMTYVPVEVG